MPFEWKRFSFEVISRERERVKKVDVMGRFGQNELFSPSEGSDLPIRVITKISD
jgi:hypothetical protein